MLLLRIAAWSREAHGRSLRAITVDHGLNPASAGWADFVVDQARALDVPAARHAVTLTTIADEGLEAAARRARYHAFAAALMPNELLLTAHHADDQAETVLLRLLRGAGLDGLGAMRPLRRLGHGWLARPWLALPRATLANAARGLGVAHVTDPANADRSRDRNALRHEVLPALVARFPHAIAALSASAAHLGRAAERMADLERGELSTIAGAATRSETAAEMPLARTSPATLATLPLAPLLRHPRPHQTTLIRRWCLDAVAAAPERRALSELAAQIGRARVDASISLGFATFVIDAWRGRLWLGPRRGASQRYALDWDGDAPLALPGGLGTVAIDPPDRGSYRVASRHGGERIDCGGSRPRQPVQRLLQSLGVPPWERARAPYLYRDDSLIAVGEWLHAPALTTTGRVLRWQRAASRSP